MFFLGTDPTFQMSNTSYNNVSSIYDTNQTTSYGQNNFPLQLDYKKFPTKLFKIQVSVMHFYVSRLINICFGANLFCCLSTTNFKVVCNHEKLLNSVEFFSP